MLESSQQNRDQGIDELGTGPQSHRGRILIASTYQVGQPAFGREPEAIARANWETNLVTMHFPG